MRDYRADQNISRMAPAKVEPERSHGLRPDHPAVVEGRTLFPKGVVSAIDAPRLFVSGHNNPKLGDRVLKGPWAGFPIYQLTLEERATCPRSCAVWSWCYGNTMPFARRHKADRHLIREMKLELLMLGANHPAGFAVRLHTLGDFYSVEYVEAWAEMLDQVPALHVFGFTARNEFEDDEDSRAIASAVMNLTCRRWDRFAIRFSRAAPVPQGSVVVDHAMEDDRVIMCPAQVEKTAACATCGLCWAEAARDKAIGFLRHGMKNRSGATTLDDEITRDLKAPPVKRSRRQPPPAKKVAGRNRPGHMIGTAAETLKTTPEERVAAVSDDVKAEIAARYGVVWKA